VATSRYKSLTDRNVINVAVPESKIKKGKVVPVLNSTTPLRRMGEWRYSSLSGIALGYGLSDQGFESRPEAGNFSLHHGVQIGSAAHPASYPLGTGVPVPGGKAAWA
jgi:hypothetical protein